LADRSTARGGSAEFFVGRFGGGVGAHSLNQRFGGVLPGLLILQPLLIAHLQGQGLNLVESLDGIFVLPVLDCLVYLRQGIYRRVCRLTRLGNGDGVRGCCRGGGGGFFGGLVRFGTTDQCAQEQYWGERKEDFFHERFRNVRRQVCSTGHY
jgi:hypothetical protein